MSRSTHRYRRSHWSGFGSFLFVGLALCIGPVYSSEPSSDPSSSVNTESSSPSTDETTKPKWTIAIHGGAGGDLDRWNDQQRRDRIVGLQAALSKGKQMLEQSATAIDVAEAVVRLLEDDPNFNAGRGTVLNEIGEYSLDASIMDGADLSCGAVANVLRARNPITLARSVRDKTPHVFLCGNEADTFGEQLGLPTAPPDYFKTEEQIENWRNWKKRQQTKKESTSKSDHDRGEDRLFYLGTVGCVVMDVHGNLAAATSTGGLLGKKYGRIGDTPVIGAGTYANNATCAISCTGVGELFIKHHIASAISARMEYLHESLETAVGHAVEKTLPVDSGGVIAVDSKGNISTLFNTPIMARGQANSDGLFRVGLGDWEQ